ncbi:MAG: hypothetical protein ACE5HY_01310 [Candidatus Hydrothermarchaeales archaeon]
MVIKIKMQVQDGKAKTNLAFEGLSFVEAKNRIDEFLSYTYRNETFETTETQFKPEFLPEWITELDLDNLSQKDKLMILLKKEHPGSWVKSQQIKGEYDAAYAEHINLSSVSTYLARFYNQGAMERKGSRAQREYRFLEEVKAKA